MKYISTFIFCFSFVIISIDAFSSIKYTSHNDIINNSNSYGGMRDFLPTSSRLSSILLKSLNDDSNDATNNKANDKDEKEEENPLFQSEGWKLIQTDLDQCPIFTCANGLGEPLAYTIDVGDQSYKVPFFYCDIEDAEKELKKWKERLKDDSIDLVPFPMGKAFRLWSNDKAVIVPNKIAIQQAGAPPNTNPIGQQVPLFACMDLIQPNESGDGGVLPLFLVLEEANAALKQAVDAMGEEGNIDEFEVVSLSLGRAVELLATVPETPAFQFIPPRKSIKYIQEYLSG